MLSIYNEIWIRVVSWQCTLSKLTISRTKRHVGVKLILISGELVTWAELKFVSGGEIDARHRQFRGKKQYKS